MGGTLYITGDPAADDLLNTDGFALLVGMLLDQQVPMEWAFHGPASLKARLGGLDAKKLAAMTPDEVVAVFCAKPALHRYPAVMGRRTHDLAVHVVEHYGGDATNIWRDAGSGDELFTRVRALPGYGQEKAQIFVAILAKRMSVAPSGWQEVAGVFADDEPRSVADIDSPATLAQVRQWKQAMRAARRDKQGRPVTA